MADVRDIAENEHQRIGEIFDEIDKRYIELDEAEMEKLQKLPKEKEVKQWSRITPYQID